MEFKEKGKGLRKANESRLGCITIKGGISKERLINSL